MMRQLRLPLVVLAVLLGWPGEGFGCRYFGVEQKTLLQESKAATAVVYGRVLSVPSAPDPMDGPEPRARTAELLIEQVLKGHPTLARRKVIRLPSGAGPDGTGPERLVVFLDLRKGQLELYRGFLDNRGELCAYLKAARALPAKDRKRAFHFFFRHLEHANAELAGDALLEMQQFAPAELKAFAPRLPADIIARWLRKPKLQCLYGLSHYSVLLGYCGTDRHADLLSKLLDLPQHAGVEGLWVGYVLLRPEDGWARLRRTLGDEKREFTARYAALRALRYLRANHANLASKRKAADAVCLLLGQEDFVDIAIEQLRKWGCWDRADRVLGVRKTAGYKLPIVRRAVLRYCLQCQGNAAAAAYIAELRNKEDGDMIEEAEELLKLEQ
jgi:hypothetical protein